MGIQILPQPSSGGNSNLTTSDLSTYSSSMTRLNKLTITNTQAVNSVPAGINMVYVMVAGGGGGGKGGSQNSASVAESGGGVGGIAFSLVPYVANATATIGAGGTGGSNNPGGNPGGGNAGGVSSYLGIVANGGSGGSWTSNVAVTDGSASLGAYGQVWQSLPPANLSNYWGSDGGRSITGRVMGRGGSSGQFPGTANDVWPTNIAGSNGLYAGGSGAQGNKNSTNIFNSAAGGGGGGIVSAGNAATINQAGSGGTGGGGGGAGSGAGRDVQNAGTNASNNYAPGGNGGSGAVIIYY